VFQATLFGVSGENITMRMRLDVFKNVLRQDVAFFDDPKHSTGKICTRLATDAPNVKAVSVFFAYTCTAVAFGLIMAPNEGPISANLFPPQTLRVVGRFSDSSSFCTIVGSVDSVVLSTISIRLTTRGRRLSSVGQLDACNLFVTFSAVTNKRAK
jgi:ABC-type multidrug transport system fused ATPase/permease subunit